MEAWSKTKNTLGQLLTVSHRQSQKKRRSVLIYTSDSVAVSSWSLKWWRTPPPPLSHFLCGGLNTAGVKAVLIRGCTPESLPQCQFCDADSPLVLVCHEGSCPTAEQRAREAAATFRSRGYEVCLIARSSESGRLPSGVACISTETVSNRIWMAASEQISQGRALPEVHKALHKEFDKMLYGV